MKRAVLFTGFLFALAAAISSCEKCTVCTASTMAGDAVTEYCGNELDVRDYEQFFVDSLEAVGVAGYCERGPDQ